MEKVVLVDEFDNAIGLMEKQEVHIKGLLHRAISVFVFNSDGELLIHQRAEGKYHSALLWTNTCCSHPRDGEPVDKAASRRLYEEMGISCELEKVFSFVYKAELTNGLTEHELDHVFVGITDDLPKPDLTEVTAWKYVSQEELTKDVVANPDIYTEWFKLCMSNWKSEIFKKVEI